VRTDAELAQLHAAMRKEAYSGSLAPILEKLRAHAGPLMGMGVGAALAKPGDELTSPMAGALGGAIGGMKGAIGAPVGLAMLRHFVTQDPQEQHGHGYR
jgi:hypothetical protein